MFVEVCFQVFRVHYGYRHVLVGPFSSHPPLPPFPVGGGGFFHLFSLGNFWSRQKMFLVVLSPPIPSADYVRFPYSLAVIRVITFYRLVDVARR